MVAGTLRLLFTFCLGCFVFGPAFAQYKKQDCKGFKDTVLRKFVYKDVDKAPEVKGGLKHLYHELSKNLIYPTGNTEYKGTVTVAFVVEPNGRIHGKRIVYDPSGKYRLFGDQILYIIPRFKWTAGICNGRAVPVLYVLPVDVSLAK